MFRIIFVLSAIGAGVLSANFPGLTPEARVSTDASIPISLYPHQASIEVYGKFRCGATILSSKYVMTGADCLGFYIYKDSYRVRVGTSVAGEGGQTAKFFWIHRHPNAIPFRLEYEVVILELTEELQLNLDVQPVRLPELNEKVDVGTKAIYLGWGQAGSTEVSRSLRMNTTTVLANTECVKVYKDKAKITDAMICAKSKDTTGTCSGDDGGALIADGKLIGIGSYLHSCGRSEFPDVYSNIPIIRDFIYKVVGV